MSNVTFDEGNRIVRNDVKTTAIARFFMKMSGGAIKDQKQADMVTLIVTLIIFAITIYILFF